MDHSDIVPASLQIFTVLTGIFSNTKGNVITSCCSMMSCNVIFKPAVLTQEPPCHSGHNVTILEEAFLLILE